MRFLIITSGLYVSEYRLFQLHSEPGPGQANLARLKLPFPEAVFEINFFRNNPIPCTSPPMHSAGAMPN